MAVLRGNETVIRNSCEKAPKSLNGPEGNVAAKTVDSVALMKWGLERLRDNMTPGHYTATNLLSCMTLDVENIHAVVHFKEPLYSVLQYSRNFGKALKESIKRTTNWSAIYYTNPKSWYPVPDRVARFIDIPDMKPLPAGNATAEEIRSLRDWAHSYGTAVRQRSVRQETTMAKAGTLSGYMYGNMPKVADAPLVLSSDEDPEARQASENADEDVTAYNIPEEYDSESDEEDVANAISIDEDAGEVGTETNFLMGTTSSFGRAARFNRHLMF